MKKAYVSPDIKIKLLGTSDLLAGSGIPVEDEVIDYQGAKTGSFDEEDDLTNYTPFKR